MTDAIATVLPRRRARWLAVGILATQLGAGLPAPLYPDYQHRFGLSTTALTGLFVSLVVGILLTLLVAGKVVAAAGARTTLVGCCALSVLAAVGYAAAPAAVVLFTASVAAGVAIGGFSAVAPVAMADRALPGGPATIGRLVAAGNAVGLATGPVWSGLLAQYAPWRGVLAYVIQAVTVAVIAAAVLRYVPAGVPSGSAEATVLPRFRVGPSDQRRFALACAAGGVAFAVGGLYSSLGSLVATDLLAVHNATLLGLVVSLLFAANAVAGFILPRRWPAGAPTVGLALLAVGLATVLVAPAAGGTAVFLVGTAVTGAGQGTVIACGVAAVGTVAPPDRTTEVAAAFFLCCYLGTAIPALSTGVLATVAGLYPALGAFGTVIGLAGATLATLTGRNAARRTA